MGSRGRGEASYVVDPPLGAGVLHYAAAMVLVAAAISGLVVVFARASAFDAPSETQDAVLVDLPPLEAGAHPLGDEAPTQQAAPASVGTETPLRPMDKPREPVETPQEAPPRPPEAAPSAVAPDAVLEKPVPPPSRTVAPASASQAAHEAGETAASQAVDNEASDAETRRASARLITLWQKALLARLQSARHGLVPAGHDTGVVKIAFLINHEGRLIAAHVAISSGSDALDAAALALVRRAAPYPTPPRDTGAAQLSFVVPISFRR